MEYQVSFGRLGAAPRAAATGKKFRLALLGDFSGRANAGRLETGEALAKRKALQAWTWTISTTSSPACSSPSRCRSPRTAARWR